ncbi:hypothetical protein A3SI_00235 [Nitritalea halalkaliphila LW7]|uniref:Uncharacterized protein n=1 Tax=Nitritalea halalkaliphila LW7 TaxID=1189621 RepID=I5CAK7_9BACT|nr:hypothetical protein [Nitritalea halalkaliphila]EIM78859.1 hypothetical protein A3SI_00235 [Nitritalea halalkaliphila LW7]
MMQANKSPKWASPPEGYFEGLYAATRARQRRQEQLLTLRNWALAAILVLGLGLSWWANDRQKVLEEEPYFLFSSLDDQFWLYDLSFTEEDVLDWSDDPVGLLEEVVHDEYGLSDWELDFDTLDLEDYE